MTAEQEQQIWQKYFGNKQPADAVRGHNDEAAGIAANLDLLGLNPSPTERVALLVYAKKNIIWIV